MQIMDSSTKENLWIPQKKNKVYHEFQTVTDELNIVKERDEYLTVTKLRTFRDVRVTSFMQTKISVR